MPKLLLLPYGCAAAAERAVTVLEARDIEDGTDRICSGGADCVCFSASMEAATNKSSDQATKNKHRRVNNTTETSTMSYS